jgi:hypothetical protein
LGQASRPFAVVLRLPPVAASLNVRAADAALHKAGSIRFCPNKRSNRQIDADSGLLERASRGLNHLGSPQRKTLIDLGNFNETS